MSGEHDLQFLSNHPRNPEILLIKKKITNSLCSICSLGFSKSYFLTYPGAYNYVSGINCLVLKMLFPRFQEKKKCFYVIKFKGVKEIRNFWHRFLSLLAPD